uniref:CDP-diacylglycerol--inositol 3-phosphatidyltransferase n=1 Tax=Physcomitrium patens TaxID=3218 RepID=A0A7I4DAY2_PHYPA|nr:probable CDP-diacylglycerol--inositol 3-phosphatidyltransferase 2 isoform X3 [Physcomitrium patens]|eukprot:XP_024369465.1 probable CDP-diacylglycerol--inositol 3-phosphatidyltransferase 2 isoform X3 [Physcomitrella patens]
MEDSTIEDSPKQRNWPIYLYIPNIIGYARIIANVAAFGVAFTNKKLFAILYFASFVCDELDGRFARMFNQKSTFGAVLDMVTDRVSTAALLVLLTHFYNTHLSSKASHKDMGDSKSTLLRLYYQHRYFMGYCAIGAEIAYILLYMLAADGNIGSPYEVARHAVAERTVYGIVLVIALPGCAIKQLVNLVQMKTAADVCVRYDTHRYSSKSQ